MKNPLVLIDYLGLYGTVIFPADQVISEVTIQMQGSREWDFRAANAEAGIMGANGQATVYAHRKLYGDVTWHHATYDPVNNTAKMQLVLTDTHKATLPHEGAVAQFLEANGLEKGTYGQQEAKNMASRLNQQQKVCP